MIFLNAGLFDFQQLKHSRITHENFFILVLNVKSLDLTKQKHPSLWLWQPLEN